MKRYDVVVVGSGIAGLFAALKASAHGSVALITKAALDESNTRYAQGGIAAALADDDSAALHAADTVSAGAGLCNPEAVDVLCSEGPARISELLELGVAFDSEDGALQRGLEAAHSRARIVHAGGDATGAFVEHSLCGAIRSAGVDIYEHAFLVDLVTSGAAVTGVSLLTADGALTLEASSVIVATGGAGQVYEHTTNPSVATGDGIAAAFRSGALISDAEFYQFHPTALAASGQPFLISEAVRGEGAVLRNAAGEAFMPRYHALADLAPRDVVARAIASEMRLQDGKPIWLDATTLGGAFLATRFPTIDRHLKSIGINWATQLVPVTPAAHYWMGGIRTDTWGRTSLANLYAVGEAACTGVHGANRLASNSLLEGLVFADRAIHQIVKGESIAPVFTDDVHQISDAAEQPTSQPSRADIQNIMWRNVGLDRNAHDMRVAFKELSQYDLTTSLSMDTASLEARNLATVASIITAAALLRTESRGAHYRSDYPATSDEWRHSLAFTC